LNKDSTQPTFLLSHSALSLLPEQVAFDLYYQLREADESNAVCIAMELPEDINVWQGVRERILKAGSKLESAE